MPKAQEVAAGLTIVGFDKDPDMVIQEIHKNAEHRVIFHLEEQGIDPSTLSDQKWNELITEEALRNPRTDVDLLISGDVADWTAPKQDLMNGALYFFLTAKAWLNVRFCYRLAQKHPEFLNNSPYLEALRRNYEFIQKNHRSLIGVARVTSCAVAGGGLGFRSVNFADLEDFTMFKQPISYDDVYPIVEVNARSVYSLVGEKADEMRSLVQLHNILPRWLKAMRFGTTLYSHMTERNWLTEISTMTLYIDQDHTASPEQVIRTYFLDFFITELLKKSQDKNAVQTDDEPLFREVTTWRGGKKTGRADYMMQLYGHWIPFEAKVSVATEPDILGQITQYTHIDSFTMLGNRFNVGQHGYCMLGDQKGIYLCKDGKWVGCSATEPLWPRTSLNRRSMQEIQRYMQNLLA